MESSTTQYFLPPGMWKEAEADAQRLFYVLTKDNPLIDLVAATAALAALVLNTEFPAEGIENFDQQLHGISSPHSSWDEFDAGNREFISHIASSLRFR